MRELVGLKVGLEYIRDAEDDLERKKSEINEMIKRRKINSIIKIASNISESFFFQWFIAIAILVNTLVLSFD